MVLDGRHLTRYLKQPCIALHRYGGAVGRADDSLDRLCRQSQTPTVLHRAHPAQSLLRALLGTVKILAHFPTTHMPALWYGYSSSTSRPGGDGTPHSLLATYLSRAVTCMSADLPSRKLPTTWVSQRISLFRRSIAGNVQFLVHLTAE